MRCSSRDSCGSEDWTVGLGIPVSTLGTVSGCPDGLESVTQCRQRAATGYVGDGQALRGVIGDDIRGVELPMPLPPAQTQAAVPVPAAEVLRKIVVAGAHPGSQV